VRILFLASSSFALPCLKGLLDSSHEILGVISQPDRPRGRGNHLHPTPVALVAHEAGLPILKPDKISSFVARQWIQDAHVDTIVALAYGQRIPKSVRELASLLALNIHPSLLPRHRGAAPIPWTILSEDLQTGVTIIEMVDEMDAGPILAKSIVPLSGLETTGSLERDLSILSRDLLLSVLSSLSLGTLEVEPQDPNCITFAPALDKTSAAIPWDKTCREVDRHIRAFSPHPGAICSYQDRRLKLLETSPPDEHSRTNEPGKIIELSHLGLRIGTREGDVFITRIQPENGKEMDIWAFARGHELKPGQRLS